jgi:acetoin utilization protein AcuB
MTVMPHSVGREQPLDVAHRIMRANRIRHLPVLDAGKLVGIVSQRDLYFIETFQGIDVNTDKVEDAMTQDVYTVPQDTRLSQVVAEMLDQKYGCAIVVEEGKVVGLFTTTDALLALAECLK